MESTMHDDRKTYAIYAITKHGIALGERLRDALPDADLYVSERYRSLASDPKTPFALPMGPVLAETFKRYDCHVHVISVGAVVRMVAPLLEDKKVDPAIVCVDDDARFAICVLSGHVGRGNEFTERIATALSAIPVVTTASDVRKTLTVDILGRELGWKLEDPDRNVTRSCAAVVNEERVAFVQETGEPEFHPIESPLPKGVRYFTTLDEVDPTSFEAILVASDRRFERTHPDHHARSVVYRPKSLVLGVGCDRGTSTELLERGVRSMLDEAGLDIRSVSSLASVDKKQDEVGLIELATRMGWSFVCLPAETLDAVVGIERPSATVARHVGTRSVAEAACLAVARTETLLVAKRIYTEPGAGRSMTFAVARKSFAKRREAEGAAP